MTDFTLPADFADFAGLPPAEQLREAVRSIQAAHGRRIDEAILRLLPYAHGLHEFRIEEHAGATVVCFRGDRQSIPRHRVFYAH